MKGLLLISVLIICQSLSAQDNVKGSISDSTHRKLHGAHIINVNSKKFTISDIDGNFEIPASNGDSLLITHIGYGHQRIIVSDSMSTDIILFQEIKMLDEVQVNIFPEYQRFKQLIIETQPVDSSLVVFGMDAIPLEYFTRKEITEKDLQKPSFGPSFEIGFDLEPLTKRGKEKRKLKKILARKELENIAHRKFNREWVAQETELSGNELTDFIAFCDFSIEFLAFTSLFEIRERMMSLLKDFKTDHSIRKEDQYTPGA